MDPAIIRRLRQDKTDPARDLQSRIRARLRDQGVALPQSHNFSPEVVKQLKRKYEEKKPPMLDVERIDPRYSLFINDGSIYNPFVVSSDLVSIIRNHTGEIVDKLRMCNNGAIPNEKEVRARAIFDWMQKNITYQKASRYRTSKEVLRDKKGKCLDQSFLYIAFARCDGLWSACVYVDVDYEGKKVSHACAAVELERRRVYVDPAYHQFDIHHKRIRLVTDLEVLKDVNRWNGNG